MDALRLFALALAAVLIGVGILLVVAAFIISELEKARKAKLRGAQPQSDIFDLLIELAKRLPLVYLPGFLMIGLGVAIVLAVVASGGLQPEAGS